jgi:hypothetical protein
VCTVVGTTFKRKPRHLVLSLSDNVPLFNALHNALNTMVMQPLEALLLLWLADTVIMLYAE